MKRFFCDRCDKDVTNAAVSHAISGVRDAEKKGDVASTDRYDHVCPDCYQAFVAFMEGLAESGLTADEHNTAVDLLRGMVGLIQLIQAREPELLANHRYVDAMKWLEERGLSTAVTS